MYNCILQERVSHNLLRLKVLLKFCIENPTDCAIKITEQRTTKIKLIYTFRERFLSLIAKHEVHITISKH